MPKANAVARLITDRRRPLSHQKHHLQEIIALLSGLIVAGLLQAAAMGQGFKPSQDDVMAGMAEPTAARSSAGDVIVTSSNEVKQVSLFLGYVEFDWDPTRPGGVPGFGPWSRDAPSASRIED